MAVAATIITFAGRFGNVLILAELVTSFGSAFALTLAFLERIGAVSEV
jgi:hypothetical protein